MLLSSLLQIVVSVLTFIFNPVILLPFGIDAYVVTAFGYYTYLSTAFPPLVTLLASFGIIIGWKFSLKLIAMIPIIRGLLYK